MIDEQGSDGRRLAPDELERLEDRERGRMADPDYRRLLQDPRTVIAALIEHHRAV